MSNLFTEVQWSPPSPSLPANHVLNSGCVIYPGAFDQQGCPLVMFPVESQRKLCEELGREEVSHFISYCLRLHNKKGEECLVSVVVDLRQANITIARFISETLLLLEFHRRMIHSVYIVQPKKKEVLKQLGKLLTPSSSKQHRQILFKCIFLKEVCELSNYIDRSQLTACLGGYLIYCHRSWVAFVKEVDVFVQEFLAVVNRLPSCISTLQSLSRLPVPTDLSHLQEFCTVNEARFHQLRRELGLDDLLKHCERLLEKLRFPENEPCFHAMAGTVLFSHTSLEMLHNYNRITAAVEKVQLLWQQAFSKAHLQLQLLHLQRKAHQIQEQMVEMQRERVQPYRIDMAKDAHMAEILRLKFETSVYTHAMALVRRAEDVIHMSETYSENLPKEQWVDDLERIKENLHSAVQLPYQTLRAVSDFHYTNSRCKNWYNLVLCESFLQDLLWSGSFEGPCEIQYSSELRISLPTWKPEVETFLRRNPCPDVEELVKLAHLANVITDPYLQHTGKQLSHRCMTLRKLLTSARVVPLQDLQLALQWQYEYLKGNQKASVTFPENNKNTCSLPQDSGFVSNSLPLRYSVSQCESLSSLAKWPSVGDCHQQVSSAAAIQSSESPGMSATGKPLSLSSFDSGFGAGSHHLDSCKRKEELAGFLGNGDSAFISKPCHPDIYKENVVSVPDSEDLHEELEFCLKKDITHASVQIVPKITSDSFNLEIKVRRSAKLPKNPWLSFPIDDLDRSYTVTVTPNSSSQQRDLKCPSLSGHTHYTDQSNQSQDLPTQTERCPLSKDANSNVHESQDSFEESVMNPLENILSSTITDEDKPNNTVNGEPSLLWDTFDLHNLRRDSFERLDGSLSDWVQREQQDLKEVEETLDRAAEILQEEEDAIAQEVTFDDLFKTENLHKHWNLWNSVDQHSLVSPKYLVESGVIGLNDDASFLLVSPQSEPSSLDSEIKILKASEICEDCLDSPGLTSESLAHVNGPMQINARCSKVNRNSIIQELGGLQVLDGQIMEENLKHHALRYCEAGNFVSELPLAHVTARSSYREKRMFLAQLKKEKQEVERMERTAKDRYRSSQIQKYVKCSVMEGNSKLKNLDYELLRNCRLKQQSFQNLESTSTTTHSAIVESDSMKFHESAASEMNPQEPWCSATELSTSQRHLCLTTEQCTGHAPPKKTAKKNGNPEVLNLASGPLSTTVTRKSVHYRSLSLDLVQYPVAFGCPHQSKLDQDVQLCHRELLRSLSESSNQSQQKSETVVCVGVLSLPSTNFSALINQEKSLNPPVKNSKDETVKACSNCTDSPDIAVDQIWNGEVDACKGSPSWKASHMQDSFGPGGTLLLTPVPAPRIAFPLNDKRTKSDSAASLCRVDTTGSQGWSFSHQGKSQELHMRNNSDPPFQPVLYSSSSETQDNVDKSISSFAEPIINSSHEKETEHYNKDPVFLEVEAEAVEASVECIDHEQDEDGVSKDCGGSTGVICRSPLNHLQLQIVNRRKTAIVLDTGSSLVKAGFADQDLPTTIFPTVIGRPKYEEIMNGSVDKEVYIGHGAQHIRGVLSLKYPMRNGVVRNWDEMEMIWHHAFQQLGVNSEDHPVLLTEAAMNPVQNRQRMVELMFEAFNVPLTFVAMQAVLALYASGRTTGVVLDSGDGLSHSVPVFEGYCLPHAVQRFSLAGVDVTLHLQKLLLEQGVCMRTSAEREIVREIKEKCCCVALDYEAELNTGGRTSSEVHYTLPDGQIVLLSTERFRAPEILFKPELIGKDHYGMHESIFRSVLQSDIDLRRSFVGNIILSGGNTLLAGLPNRLQKEIRNMVPTDLMECVRVTSPNDRDFSVWSGGAMLASLPVFSSAWISTDEYEEFGPQIVFRKCF